MIRIVEPEDNKPKEQSGLVKTVSSIFREGGYLQAELGLEYRPQQEQMALHTAQAFAENKPLLFEAGTGVGKSLAYLIPGILHAMDAGRPFIVSTHTISLQEQIHNKDLPLCRRFFSRVKKLEKYGEFKTALLVGKANYLCETRLARALQGQAELFEEEECAELERIRAWARETKTGQRQELVPPPRADVWDQVNADSSNCNRKHCGEKGCSYRRARSRLLSSHVRIVNHSLLFSLLNAGMGPGGKSRGILFPEDFLVLDEAHTVPAIATDHFGIAVSSYSVNFALNRLYNPKKDKGLLKKIRDAKARDLVQEAHLQNKEFFGILMRQYLSRREILRLREPGWASPLLQLPLKHLADRLATLESQAKDEDEEQEIADHRLRISGIRESLDNALHLADEEQVYWIEKTGRKQSIVTLRSAPIDIAPLLNKALFQRGTSTLMTSATLSLEDRMENFRNKVGGQGVDFAIESSPFDFPKRMEIYISTPPESPDSGLSRGDPHQVNIPHLCRYLLAFLERQTGGAMVLFTSYRDLTATRLALSKDLHGLKRPLFSQGEGLSRSELVREFQRSGNAVLLGTESFWTGVDIPGPALSLIVIPRLPFENPTHPVAEAKSEWLKMRGGNPFMQLTLPEALIKFRQGIGRLIRNQDDRGRLLILDPRIIQREYGRLFLAVLPHRNYRKIRFQQIESIKLLSLPKNA